MAETITTDNATIMTNRRVLWCQVVAVSIVTVSLFQANGDLHAVHPVGGYLIVLPAVFSLFLFPGLLVIAMSRDSKGRVATALAGTALELMHFAVVSAGFSSY